MGVACSMKAGCGDQGKTAPKRPNVMRLISWELSTNRSGLGHRLRLPEVSLTCRSTWGFRRANREVKGCSLFHRSRSPNLSAMSLNDSSYRCKADAISRKFGTGVKSLKGLEQALRRPWIEATAVILHEIDVPTTFIHHPEFNSRMIVMRSVLP